ncbi:MAG: DUF899 family protein [Acidobacteriaceae bacterium]|nr:DUF899 family protein [Acidobacteriaceae bacterium]
MRPGRLASESDDYRRQRDELLKAEIALREQLETVAALRRQLPLDSDLPDYVFHEGPADLAQRGPIKEVRLSGLFHDPTKPLVMYQYMFGGAQNKPCRMCTMWVDGFNSVTHYLQETMNFAIIAQAGIRELREWGRRRNWHGLRLISSEGSEFKNALGFQNEGGRQWPGISVFVLSQDGSVKHFYSACAQMADHVNRGIDLLTPVWNLLDLTPYGRGEWMPRLEYSVETPSMAAPLSR